jgi:hypothetical protein
VRIFWPGWRVFLFGWPKPAPWEPPPPVPPVANGEADVAPSTFSAWLHEQEGYSKHVPVNRR